MKSLRPIVFLMDCKRSQYERRIHIQIIFIDIQQRVEAIEYSLIGSWVYAVEFNVTDCCVLRLRHEMRGCSSPICLYILDNKKPLGNYDTLRADNISSTVHKQDDYHRWIWRAIKVFERFNIALRLRGRYTLLLGLGRYRKSIYVNPLGRKPPCIRGVGCKAVLLRGCGVSWGIMPTLDGLTVWAWQVLTVPGSLERNTLGWGMVWVLYV